MSLTWDRRFMALARHISSWSKDPSTQCGAVIVDRRRRIISLGFNGFPAGVRDTAERLADRNQKYQMMVHAEVNALMFAQGRAERCALYASNMPCADCAKLIVQAGIIEVVSCQDADYLSRWGESVERSSEMMKEAGILLRCLSE